MSEVARETLDRHGEMKQVRALEEPAWRDIALVLRPDDRDFDAHLQRRRDDTAIFDATQIYALDSFAGGIFGQLTNPANRWFEYTIADKDLNNWQPVKTWLWRRANMAYASFSEAVSPFYSEVPAWFSNIGAFGFGAMYQEERVGMGRIIDRSIPIGEIFLDTDAEGEINTLHREFSLTGRQAKRKFKMELAGTRDDTRYVFVHAVCPNEEYRPGRVGPDGMAFRSCYASPDLRDFYVPGGYYELPYHVPRWNRRSGRPYPTGPGHTTRADMTMLQEMERSHIVAGQFAAEPPILVHDESVLTAADVAPNAMLYGTMNNESGKKVIDHLFRGQDLKLSMAQSEQRRNAIRTAFYYGIMQLVQRPQMTATEFLGFQEETLKLMAPNLVRIQTDGLSPLIGRRYRILARAGQFDHDPPPQELAGQSINIEYVSPLAKLLKVGTARGLMQWIGALGQIAAAGKPEVMDKLDGDRAADVLHAAFVDDPSVLADPKAVAQVRQNRAAQQQAAQQLEAAQTLASVHADVSHANQAQTLAKGRQPA